MTWLRQFVRHLFGYDCRVDAMTEEELDRDGDTDALDIQLLRRRRHCHERKRGA